MPDPEPEYRLNDGRLLAHLMRNPGPGGHRHTVRSLATAAGVSKSKISNMLHDRQPKLPHGTAAEVAKEVGFHRKALFTPIASTFMNEDDPQEGER